MQPATKQNIDEPEPEEEDYFPVEDIKDESTQTNTGCFPIANTDYA